MRASERGAGSALVIGVVAALVAATVAVLLLVPLLVARHRAAVAADAAALAAADVALGAAAGVPCERAAAVAEAAGVRLVACRQRCVRVRVRASVPWLSATVSADAEAGPDPGGPPEDGSAAPRCPSDPGVYGVREPARRIASPRSPPGRPT
jgi:secretion/DNA translocation related TadE-like protein